MIFDFPWNFFRYQSTMTNRSDLREVVYNQTLYKMIGLFYVLDPNRKHINDYHIYRYICIVLSTTVTCFMFFGNLGILMNLEESANTSTNMSTKIFEIIIFLSSILKMNVFVYKAKYTWDLLDVTRIHFLSSSKSSKINEERLKKCQQLLVRFTNAVFILEIIMCLVYMINPLVVNLDLKKIGNVDQKLRNILQMQYPVRVDTFNGHYYVFFVMESITLVFNAYSLFIDSFLLSIAFVITNQYKILTHTFERIGAQGEYDGGKFFF